MNVKFLLTVAGWMPVINLGRSAGDVLWFVTFCCTILQRNPFLLFMHGRTEFVNEVSKAMFSVLQRRELFNDNG